MTDWTNAGGNIASASQMSTSDPFGSFKGGLEVAMSIKKLREDKKYNRRIAEIRDSDMSEMDKLQAYSQVDMGVASDYAAYLVNAAKAEEAFDPFFKDLRRRKAVAGAELAENQALTELRKGQAYVADAAAAYALGRSRDADANRTANQQRIDSETWTQVEKANIPMGERRYWDERGLAERKKGNKYATDAAGQRMIDSATANKIIRSSELDADLNAAIVKYHEGRTRNEAGESVATIGKIHIEGQAVQQGADDKTRKTASDIETQEEIADQTIEGMESEMRTAAGIGLAEKAKIDEQTKEVIARVNRQDEIADQTIENLESEMQIASGIGLAEKAKIDGQTKEVVARVENAKNLNAAEVKILEQDLKTALAETKTEEARELVQKAIVQLREAQAQGVEDRIQSIVSYNEKKTEVLGNKSVAEIEVFNQEAKAIASKSFSDSLTAAARQHQIGAQTQGLVEEFALKHANLLAKGEFNNEKYAAELNLLLQNAEMNDVQKAAVEQAMELGLEEAVVKLNTMLDESRATVAKTEAQTLAIKTTNEAEVNLLKEELINLTNERYNANFKARLEREGIQGDNLTAILMANEQLSQLRNNGEMTKEEHMAKLEQMGRDLQLTTQELSILRQSHLFAAEEHELKMEINEAIGLARKDLLVARTSAVNDGRIQSNMNAIQAREFERNKQALIEAGLSEENAQRIAINKHLLSEAKYDSEISQEELKKLGIELQISQINLDKLPGILEKNAEIREQELLKKTAEAQTATSRAEQQEFQTFTSETLAQIEQVNYNLAVANEAVEMIELAPEIRAHMITTLEGTPPDQRAAWLEQFVGSFFDGNPDNNPENLEGDFQHMERNKGILLGPLMGEHGEYDLSNSNLENAERSIVSSYDILSDKAARDKATAENLTHEYNAFRAELLNPGTPIEIVFEFYAKAIGTAPTDRFDYAEYEKQMLPLLRKMREEALSEAVERTTGAPNEDETGEPGDEALNDLLDTILATGN